MTQQRVIEGKIFGPYFAIKNNSAASISRTHVHKVGEGYSGPAERLTARQPRHYNGRPRVMRIHERFTACAAATRQPAFALHAATQGRALLCRARYCHGGQAQKCRGDQPRVVLPMATLYKGLSSLYTAMQQLLSKKKPQAPTVVVVTIL